MHAGGFELGKFESLFFQLFSTKKLKKTINLQASQ